MKKYDTIEVVEKGVDEIEVVEKFNPFHDSRGRFSNKNGFASYSANPNTKAGAMAIARSAAAGHGKTMNVHQESYGETIRQNANWLGHHNYNVGPRQTGSGTLTQRVEPKNGLAGASAHGYVWQYYNRLNNRTTKPNKQTQNQQQQGQQQPQKPAPAKQPKPQQTQQKPAQQQQTAQQKPANDRKPVDGKDISATYKYDSRQGGNALNQVAKQQGYDGKPTVVKDRKEFSKAVQESGIMAYRTINAGTDVVTGKHKTGAEFANDLKNGDTFSHNGSGGRAFGSGIYIAATSNPVQGKAPSRTATDSAKQDSQCYGYTGSKTVGLTLTKDAKVGDYNQLYSEFNRMHASTRNSKYGPDKRDGFGAFCASKGYDAICAKGAGYGCDYIVVYNRTKLVVFDG